MNRRDALAEINSTLKNIGFSEKSAIIPQFEGTIKVHGKPIDIQISIPDTGFSELPIVKIKDRSQLDPEIVGHLVDQGTKESGICYSSEVGLPLDIYQPGGSILRVLEQAREALEVNYKGRGAAEVAAEYQEYWRDGLMSFRIFADRSGFDAPPQKLGYFAFKNDSGALFFALRDSSKLHGYKSTKLADGLLLHSAKSLVPVGKMKIPMTLEQLEVWFKGQSGLSVRDYRIAFATLSSRGFVAISAPNCVLGIQLQFPADLKVGLSSGKIRSAKMPTIIEDKKSTIALKRYGGFWCDLGTLAERNLVGMDTLAQKKIALVGCGTLGSHLAKFLVQSGAGATAPLLLFDRQSLSAGNVGRHYLGTEYIGSPKASALSDELKRFHPDAKLMAFVGNVFDEWDRVKACDIIIDATGDWNTQNAINDRLLSDEDAQAESVLYSWICDNGAAVQSFLSLPGDDYCFRCLRPDPSKPWRYTAVNPKYEATVHEATCGDGAYYPYSVAAPAIGAGLSTEMIIGWVNGKPGPRLKTIIVNHERGIDRKPMTPTASKDCPACAARRTND